MAVTSAVAAGIMAVTSAVGSVVSGISYYQSNKAQAANAQAQADAQAQALNLQAQVETENSKLAAAEKRIEAHRTASKQIVAGASAGINLQSSSFSDIMTETAQLYEKDATQLERTGALQSSATTYSASMYDTVEPDNSGLLFGAVGTALGGLGTSYYYGDKAGWFD